MEHYQTTESSQRMLSRAYIGLQLYEVTLSAFACIYVCPSQSRIRSQSSSDDVLSVWYSCPLDTTCRVQKLPIINNYCVSVDSICVCLPLSLYACHFMSACVYVCLCLPLVFSFCSRLVLSSCHLQAIDVAASLACSQVRTGHRLICGYRRWLCIRQLRCC